jgi:N-acylneuraminate cytidylyltransferase
MNILGIIPARGGSKGIPMKNLTMLDKKPLLSYTISSSLKSKIDRTVVSTENEKISEVAKEFGAEVIKRPKMLATDESQIEPVMMHVLEQLQTENYIPDIIVLLQNTSPLRSSQHIDSALEVLMNNNCDSVLSCYASHYNLWTIHDDLLQPVNHEPLKRQNRQNMKNQFAENGAIYMTKNTFFAKSSCRVSGRIGIFKMSEEDSTEIDTPNDLLIAERILEMRNKK